MVLIIIVTLTVFIVMIVNTIRKGGNDGVNDRTGNRINIKEKRKETKREKRIVNWSV